MQAVLEWQLMDSLFPVGAFAHSYGLEVYQQENRIVTMDMLMFFLNNLISSTIGMNLPFVVAGYDAEQDLEEMCSINEYCDAVLSNNVSKRASLAMGKALVRLSSVVYAGKLPWIQDCVGKECHYAVLFGKIAQGLGIDRMQCLRMFTFGTVRDCLSAATRLNILGPMESARVLHVIASTLEHRLVAGIKENIDYKKVYQTSPLLEITQGRHDTLYTRIFNS